MPKTPLTARLSIVVPVGKDTIAFETSLISVLEHRPSGCEVIVAHDGSYDDPFELSDEVRFVVSDTSEVSGLVESGVELAKGRFIHVISNGLKATSEWVDAALEKFEHQDVAAVAPVVRQTRDGEIVALGWHDHAGRLCDPSCAGTTEVDRPQAMRTDGVFIDASFWRSDVLRSAMHCYRGSNLLEASYAAGLALKKAGWRSVSADGSDLVCEGFTPTWNVASFTRGKRLWAIRQSITKDRRALRDGVRSAMRNLASPDRFIESLGQLSGKSVVAEMQRRVHWDEIREFSSSINVIPMRGQKSEAYRRAA
ncbi:glycosyltransferase family A protein [Planctomycetes bacterium CA13]|uniref:glycosyltransferase family A protein n=1 Tax=Novipirellula herctigrandis TaxID=2527986 RepID=UPI0011B7F604